MCVYVCAFVPGMFDGANMDGRTLEVRYDRKAGGGRGGASGGGGGGGGRGGKGGSRNVYVGNLDFGVRCMASVVYCCHCSVLTFSHLPWMTACR